MKAGARREEILERRTLVGRLAPREIACSSSSSASSQCVCGGHCPRCVPTSARPAAELGSTPGAHERRAERLADEVLRLDLAPGVIGEGAAQARPPRSKGCGGGEPLRQTDRDFFEPRFGHDFDSVRIHHDGRAGDLAQSAGARALTIGNDIYFGKDAYREGASSGQRMR